MTIYVNNSPFEFTSSINVEELLRKACFDSAQHDNNHKGIAVAVNNTVVPKKEWINYTLKENDKVIVIKATQGG